MSSPESTKRSRDEEEESAETESAEPPAKVIKQEETTSSSSPAAPAPETTTAADNPAAEETKPDQAASDDNNNNNANNNAGGGGEETPTTTTEAAPALAPAPAAQHASPAPAPPAPVASSAPSPAVVATSTYAPPAGVPLATSPSSAVPGNSAHLVEETGQVSSLYVGRVIGKGGEMIRDLQARSGCRIDVDQSVPPGQPRIITYRGTRKTVDFAKRLVQMLCNEHVNEADLPLGEAKREIMAVPATSVGKIIGRGGEMIRELQSRSHAKIQVDHNSQGTNGIQANQKRLTITGTEQSVIKAKEMVEFLVANPMMDAMQALTMLVEDKLHRGGVWGSGPPYLNMPNSGINMVPAAGAAPGGGDYSPSGGYAADPYAASAPPAYGQYPPVSSGGYGVAPPAAAMPPSSYGGMESEVFYAAKNFMGRIIGQKGITINDLQRRSGCDIQINQEVPHGSDCEISLRGTRQGIESAKQMLREIIEIGPNHPYAGGAAQSAGYGGGAYGHDPYAQPQQPSYGYGGQQAYGGYPQQPVYGYSQPYDQQHAPQYGYGQPPQAHMYAAPASYGGMPPQQAYGGYSAAPPIPTGASPWKSATAGDGQIYYYNEKTGETQWEKPPGMP